MDKAYNMRIFILSVVTILAVSTVSLGQSLQNVLEVGEESFAERDYYSAFQCYKTILRYPDRKVDANEIYLKYRMALSAQRFNYFEMADSMYQEVLLMSEADNTAFQALATYQRAQVLYSMGTDELETPVLVNPAQDIIPAKSNAVYFLADSLFGTFVNDELYKLLDGPDNMKERYKEMANVYKKECEKALSGNNSIDDTKVYRLEHAGVNSSYSDLAPVLLGDELYFSSLRHLPKAGKSRRQSRTYSKMHRAVLPDGNPLDSNYTEGLLLENNIFNIDEDLHTVHTAFTADKQYLYFSSCGQEGDSIRCQLYRRKRANTDEWGIPEKLSINVANEKISSTQPSISIDCKTGKEWLYFSSDRSGGVGGMDIWRSEISENGKLSDPIPLPVGTVNTPWNEATPFYHATSGRLFFSSDAPPGFGMYDLFYCQSEGDNVWSSRVNMGLPINTGYNDQYYFMKEDGSRAFFSSDRPRSMRFREELNACCQDIYTQEIEVDMQLEIELLACVNNESVSVTEASVRVFENECGKKVEVSGSPFTYNGERLNLGVKRFNTYFVEAELQNRQTQESIVNLADEEYLNKDVANVSLDFFPETLDYRLEVLAEIPPQGTLEYNLILEKDGLVVKQEEYRPAHQFELNEGIYTITISEAFAISASASFEFDTLRYEITVPSYEERLESYTCTEREQKTLVKSPPKLGFPIVFYFDNDKPDRLDHDNNPATKGLAHRSGQSYDESYIEYADSVRMAEYLAYNMGNPEGVATFIKENEVNPNPGQAAAMLNSPPLARTIAERTIQDFFQNEVIGQFETFNNFMDGLIIYLDDANTNPLTLEIQGYCSPLGGVAYNKLLAQRRIECIMSYMTNYRGGALNKYLGDKLIINQNDIGVTQLFTDTPTKGQNAIFDYRALLARKVEIKDVSGETFQLTFGDE